MTYAHTQTHSDADLSEDTDLRVMVAMVTHHPVHTSLTSIAVALNGMAAAHRVSPLNEEGLCALQRLISFSSTVSMESTDVLARIRWISGRLGPNPREFLDENNISPTILRSQTVNIVEAKRALNRVIFALGQDDTLGAVSGLFAGRMREIKIEDRTRNLEIRRARELSAASQQSPVGSGDAPQK